MFKFCKNCGFETERNKAGACKICHKRAADICRARTNALPTPPPQYCPKCDMVTERRKDNWCRECDRRRVQARRDAGLVIDTRKYADKTPEQKARAAASGMKWAKANPEKIKATRDKPERKAKAKARGRQWVKDNPDRQKERVARYHAENPHKAIERSRVRRGAMKNRTPAWADQAAIRAIYLQAAEFRDAGIDCEVDHIYPLQGELVSGLHCEANLQIISAHKNRSKQNRSPDHDEHTPSARVQV